MLQLYKYSYFIVGFAKDIFIINILVAFLWIQNQIHSEFWQFAFKPFSLINQLLY